jgi:putative SOS response-associated peptidase YedK
MTPTGYDRTWHIDYHAVGHATATEIRRPPVTNIRNVASPHSRGWLKPENRCLVPANSFSEYAPKRNPETGKKDVVWFALSDSRPLFAFAGIWTEFQRWSWHPSQSRCQE